MVVILGCQNMSYVGDRQLFPSRSAVNGPSYHLDG